MESWTRPDAPPTPAPRMCPDCGERLSAGRRWRCAACVEAALVAIKEIIERPITPSDIAARRNA
jgi:tRNA(Ile2) C34 agmatinyltransferase TiaS